MNSKQPVLAEVPSQVPDNWYMTWSRRLSWFSVFLIMLILLLSLPVFAAWSRPILSIIFVLLLVWGLTIVFISFLGLTVVAEVHGIISVRALWEHITALRIPILLNIVALIGIVVALWRYSWN